jgi:hypothetical protein
MTTATQSEFAAILGKDKSYVTRLKQADRLVLVGNLVDVEASQARIAATAHPSYAKPQAAQNTTSAQNAPRGENGGRVGQGYADQENGTASAPQQARNAYFNEARARNEMAKAEIAEMERDAMRRKLVDSDEVRLYSADLGATFRGALEILPDRIAAELVPLTDVETIRSVLVEALEQVLHDLAIKIEKGVA